MVNDFFPITGREDRITFTPHRSWTTASAMKAFSEMKNYLASENEYLFRQVDCSKVMRGVAVIAL